MYAIDCIINWNVCVRTLEVLLVGFKNFPGNVKVWDEIWNQKYFLFTCTIALVPMKVHYFLEFVFNFCLKFFEFWFGQFMVSFHVVKLPFTLHGYVLFVCVWWPRIFICVLDGKWFIFGHDHFTKCFENFLTQILHAIKYGLVFNQFNDSISNFLEKFIHLFMVSLAIKCLLSQNCFAKQNIPSFSTKNAEYFGVFYYNLHSIWMFDRVW